jgi:hypothetical protein
MSVRSWPTNTPLTQLRAQGFDAEFMTAHLIVYPRPKITETIRQFVVSNLESIVDEVNLEGYYRKNPDRLGYQAKSDGNSLRSQGVLIWQLNSTMRTHIGAKTLDPVTESFPNSLNGNLPI